MTLSLNTKKRNFKRLLLFSLIICVIGLLVLFLELNGFIDLYKKPVNKQVVPSENTIDFTPAKENEKINDDQKKQDDKKSDTEETSSYSVILNSSSQDAKGGPLVVRAMLSGFTGGDCNLTLTNGSVVKTYSSKVEWSGNYYICSAFNVGYGEIFNGEWNIDLSVSQGEISKSINSKTIIEGP